MYEAVAGGVVVILSLLTLYGVIRALSDED
jgi:hypothetical protein